MAGKKQVEYAKPKVIKFSREYQFNGEWTDELKMREPTIQDEIIAQETAPNEKMIQLQMFANLCDISLDELKQLSSKDGMKVAKAYEDFLS